MMSVKADPAICSSVKGASGVKLLCVAKIWILAIALNNYMSGFCESIIQSHNIIIKQLNH